MRKETLFATFLILGLVACGGGGGGGDLPAPEILDVLLPILPPLPGSLDRSFGNQGSIVSSYPQDDMAFASAGDSNGNLYVTGRVKESGSWRLAIWKFSPNGTSDSTFGDQGIVVDQDPNYLRSEGHSILVDEPRARLLIAGELRRNTYPDAALWEYDLNGTRLSSPNLSTPTSDTVPEAAFALCVHPTTSRIYLTGFRGTEMALWQAENAELSPIYFGADGSAGRAILGTLSGDLLVIGGARDNAGSEDMTIWRFGAIDQAPEVIQSSLQGGDEGLTATQDSTGRVLVAGHCGMRMTVWRYTSDLDPDPSFGNGTGYVKFLDPTVSDSRAYAIRADQEIYVAGYVDRSDGQSKDLALWRYDVDGNLDPLFGKSGLATHHNAAGGNGADIGRSIVFDLEGRILVVGESSASVLNRDLAVWRFLP